MCLLNVLGAEGKPPLRSPVETLYYRPFFTHNPTDNGLFTRPARTDHINIYIFGPNVFTQRRLCMKSEQGLR
jgi:hypothetical protein